MSPSVFWKTIIAGVVATFVMTMTGFWQHGIGIRPVDIGAMLTANMTSAHPGTPYSLVAGNLAHLANGVILAFLWVAIFRQYVPGSWLVHGFVYGVALALAASVVYFPLIADVGVFFSGTSAPGAMLLASTIVYLAYGFALALSLEVAGIGASAAERVAEGVRLEIWTRRERRRA
jgi:uncharacterized membrane protein YagU involved in acid resistance